MRQARSATFPAWRSSSSYDGETADTNYKRTTITTALEDQRHHSSGFVGITCPETRIDESDSADGSVAFPGRSPIGVRTTACSPSATDAKFFGASSFPRPVGRIIVKIFVNYRSDDAGQAAILLDHVLVERFGPDRVFRDSRSIPLGADFRPQLWGDLARSAVLIAIIGRRWAGETPDGRRRIDDPDDFIRREIALALKIGIRVVPVLLDNVSLPPESELPADIQDIASRQYLRLHTRSAERDVQHLVESLAQMLGDESPAVSAAVNTRGKYTVNAPHGKGFIIGDHATQTISFAEQAEPPPVVGVQVGSGNRQIIRFIRRVYVRLPRSVQVGVAGFLAAVLLAGAGWIFVTWVRPQYAPVYKTQFLIDAANSAEPNGEGAIAGSLNAVVQNSGDRDALALRTFGGACGADDNTRQRVDFGLGNRQAISQAASTVRQGGQATLLRGIVEAVADFSSPFALKAKQVSRVIVVTRHSDDACDNDAEFVTTEIRDRVSASGLRIEFRFVGYGIPPAQRNGLERIAAASGASAPVFADTPPELQAGLDWFANVEPVLRDANEVVATLNPVVEQVNAAVTAITNGRLDVAGRSLDQVRPAALDAWLQDLHGRARVAAAQDIAARAARLRDLQQQVISAADDLLSAARSGAVLTERLAGFRRIADEYNAEVASMNQALAALRAKAPGGPR